MKQWSWKKLLARLWISIIAGSYFGLLLGSSGTLWSLYVVPAWNFFWRPILIIIIVALTMIATYYWDD